MSGLEAVAAFALACNVMQVVEAGYKTVGTCKRIYQTGQPDPALDGYGGQLRDISSALETQLNKTTGPLSPDDTRLRDLAARSAAIANGLLDQIASVSKSAGKRTIGSSICLAIKSRFKQSDLSRWERDLEKAQSTMETQLLVGLRQRVDANMLQNDEMDRELSSYDEYDDTEDDWEDTDDDDNGNNDNDEDGDEGDEGDDSDDDNDDDEDEGSHSTGSIDSDISMSPDSSDAPTWDSFPQWLQSSEPVYWISEALVYGHVDFGSISEMVTEIVSASDGVFLWVVLLKSSGEDAKQQSR
ncbi:hypothetical protein BHE90_014272 [Fusarium euwallaceae]|uniref:Fungal N-terminal domain-containing protein n=1 Tax=Fusarium euwallaceae TaxID=1147111 RepID=A0A430L6P8_9HYPO|nr:hypothetical protein BHE90_014272 [Fusarium euwallaceae]